MQSFPQRRNLEGWIMINDRVTVIGKKIGAGKASINEITEFLSSLLPSAITEVNDTFAPRQLTKRDRVAEPLPTAKRQLASYRTRLGTILEYALSTHMDASIKDRFAHNLRLTFAVAHEYPDFFVRDAVLGPRMRIEMKAVDAASDEQAARFEVLTSLIQGEKDVVVLIGWEWVKGKLPSGIPCEFPQVFSFIVVPSADLAGERDRSVILRGGRVDADAIMVPSKKDAAVLTKDKGNAGKMLRLVHRTRKAEGFALSGHIQKYLQFCESLRARNAKQRAMGRIARKVK